MPSGRNSRCSRNALVGLCPRPPRRSAPGCRRRCRNISRPCPARASSGCCENATTASARVRFFLPPRSANPAGGWQRMPEVWVSRSLMVMGRGGSARVSGVALALARPASARGTRAGASPPDRRPPACLSSQHHHRHRGRDLGHRGDAEDGVRLASAPSPRGRGNPPPPGCRPGRAGRSASPRRRSAWPRPACPAPCATRLELDRVQRRAARASALWRAGRQAGPASSVRPGQPSGNDGGSVPLLGGDAA